MKSLENDDLVSVVIPIYNVEKYIRECIDSIINQSYKNLEIILVDDGSTDNCPKICDEYAKNDSRIKVIHKTNGGLSSARNEGIAVARGKYITFVDSDDFCNKKFIECLHDICQNYDCEIALSMLFPFHNINEIQLAKENGNISLYTGKEMCENIFSDIGISCVPAQDKLYLTELFKEIKYPIGKLHEDEYVTYKIFWTAKKVGVVESELYYYRQSNVDSIMHSKYNIRRLDCIPALEERNEFFKKKGEKLLFKKSLLMYGNQLIYSFEGLETCDDNNYEITQAKKRIKCKMRITSLYIIFMKDISSKNKISIFIRSWFHSLYIRLRGKVKKNEKSKN